MKDYSSYVALIVATETEEKAIKNMYDWKPVTFSDDTQTYYSASIEKNGSSHKIMYARQSEMGMTVAVTLTMKLIEQPAVYDNGRNRRGDRAFEYGGADLWGRGGCQYDMELYFRQVCKPRTHRHSLWKCRIHFKTCGCKDGRRAS